MIVLDAGVLIGLNDSRDAHHVAAARFFEANAADSFVANAVNLGESLVRVISSGLAEQVLEQYEILGIEPIDIPGESAAGIARVRSETGLRMPDALLIHSAERSLADLATTDAALARAAESRGIRVHLLVPEPSV